MYSERIERRLFLYYGTTVLLWNAYCPIQSFISGLNLIGHYCDYNMPISRISNNETDYVCITKNDIYGKTWVIQHAATSLAHVRNLLKCLVKRQYCCRLQTPILVNQFGQIDITRSRMLFVFDRIYLVQVTVRLQYVITAESTKI